MADLLDRGSVRPAPLLLRPGGAQGRARLSADPHPEEERRLGALHGYDILDTPREAEFDEVVQTLSRLLDMPVALISLVDADRQWFKAETGFHQRETPLGSSICAHAILQHDVLEVRDTWEDGRFADNPLVSGNPPLRFYAGALLETGEGLPLGTLCVLDHKPRELTTAQRDLLRLAARQVMRQLELRRKLAEERAARRQIEALLEQNRLLAREVDHRVKNSLQLVSSLLGLQARQSEDAEVQAALAAAGLRVGAVAGVHEQLCLGRRPDRVSIPDFMAALAGDIGETRPAHVCRPAVAVPPGEMRADRAVALGLVLNELLTNAFRHAFPDATRPGHVAVTLRHMPEGDLCLRVEDDGEGLPEAFDPDLAGSLGIRVLFALAARLEGEVSFHRLPRGTAVEMRFPRPAAEPG